MPLTQDQLNKLNSWITSKGIKSSCPACSVFPPKWEAGDLIVANTVIDGNISIGGGGIPFVPLVCSNCGFARLFAAVLIGLAQ